MLCLYIIGGMFLWHFPHGRPHWELPSGLVFGSPDFPQTRMQCEPATPFADSLSFFSLVVVNLNALGKFHSRIIRFLGIDRTGMIALQSAFENI